MKLSRAIVFGAFLMGAGLGLNAGNVIDVKQASNPGGRTISIRESQQGVGYARMTRYFWAADGTLTEKPARPAMHKWTLPVTDSTGISYGTSVSRNEFGINGGVFPSPDRSRLAVYRKDESRVSVFPLLDIRSRTGSLVSVPYPMNGMPSEHIDLCICDTLGTVLTRLKVDDFTEERYLTNVAWSPDGQSLFVQVVDRPQHHMHLNRYDAVSGECMGTLLSEENDAWIEPLDPVSFIDGEHFIYRTDNRDGYRNLYLCDLQGGIRRMTCVDADVQLVTFHDGWLYYTSAEVSPVENHLFRMQVKPGKTLAKTRFGKPQQLTDGRGWHSVSMSPDKSSFIDSWSNVSMPGKTVLRSCDGTLLRELSSADDPFKDIACCEVEFGSTESADGGFQNYYRLIKPLGFDPSRQYPLIVYVYGGPHSQMVQDKWLGGIRMWEMAMAQRGYVVYVQDNRGTQNRGAAFEKAINRYCGQQEMADQVAGIKALMARSPWIDPSRVGVHGWSYGGFMTISLATNYPDMFKVAVAGGPVIDWKWYEVMYGERYMDTPQTNPDGFKATSLIEKAPQLKAKLLICQGAIDQTVVWEHSLSFVQKCIEEGVQLDYFPYPLDEHNMVGKARLHLYEKITDYFTERL